MQLPLLTPDALWRPPKLEDLPSWAEAKRIAIDCETYDPSLRELGPGVRRGGYIAGISFAIEDGPKHYLPLRHALGSGAGDNMESPENTIKWIQQQASMFSGDLVGANLSYDLDWLWAAKIYFPNVKKYKDIQIYEALIDELQLSYSLEKISQKYLGIGKAETLLKEAATAFKIDCKRDLHILPARYVAPYAIEDAALPLLILRRQEKEIEEQELENIVNLESDLLPVLVRMRQRGVRVNQDKLTQIEEWSKEQERIALQQIYDITNVKIPFNSVWQPTALVAALQSIGCKIPLTPKTRKPSIDKAYLNSIDHPVAKAISRARRVNKVRTTFVNSIREHTVKDRIHCTYHQLRSSDDDDDEESSGARYGRCSSQNPNMQQQPARDPEIGPLWRSGYIPEEGEIWCSADFSSQEPRHAVHYATKTRLGSIKMGGAWIDADRSAQQMAEKYNSDRKTDPHQALGDIIHSRSASKEERSDAKIIFLGLSYGMGGAKLCRSLGYPTIMGVRALDGGVVAANTEEGKIAIANGARIFEAAGPEGQALLDKFDKSVPFVRALNNKCKKAASQRGYIRTEMGRKCRFPKDALGNYDFTHKALNRLIQGSSADQTKKSMIELDKQGFFLVLQIHDENCCSVKNHEEAKRIGEIMENTYKLSVPTIVSVECGPSWGEAKEI